MTEVPKYRQVAESLRTAILSGDYETGTKLPSETQLIDLYGASRTTVRQALALLNNEGLTEARKGSGVWVADVSERQALHAFKPIIRIETTRGSAWKLGRSMWERDVEGREFAQDQLKTGRVTAPGRVARVIGTEDAGFRSRRYWVDGRPGLLSVSYLPHEIAGGTQILEPDTGPDGTYGILRDLGFEIAGFSMQVWARTVEGDEPERLGISTSASVLCAARTAFTETGRAVEVNEMVMNPAMFVLQFNWDA